MVNDNDLETAQAKKASTKAAPATTSKYTRSIAHQIQKKKKKPQHGKANLEGKHLGDKLGSDCLIATLPLKVFVIVAHAQPVRAAAATILAAVAPPPATATPRPTRPALSARSPRAVPRPVRELFRDVRRAHPGAVQPTRRARESGTRCEVQGWRQRRRG